MVNSKTAIISKETNELASLFIKFEEDYAAKIGKSFKVFQKTNWQVLENLIVEHLPKDLARDIERVQFKIEQITEQKETQIRKLLDQFNTQINTFKELCASNVETTRTKDQILASIVQSEQFINLRGQQKSTAKSVLFKVEDLKAKTLEQLLTLKVTRIDWRVDEEETDVFSLTLNDGSTCKAGSFDCESTYEFDEHDKITKVIVYEKPNAAVI